jgi:CheY-like chemotaxis protein
LLSDDSKFGQRICAHMQRVLIVDPHSAAVRLLSELLRDFCPCQIWTATNHQRGVTLAERIDPHIIFVEQCDKFDGAAFSRDVRRSDFACRKAPIIMITSEATATAILNARDAGVHEFLRKPYTIKDLLRRLEAVTLRGRDWVEGIDYVGPDRRRFNSGDYLGTLKRRVDHAETPDEARVIQALRILKAALDSIERDPHQAMRAMVAQAEDLATVAQSMSDARLRAAALALGQHLAGLELRRLRLAEIEPLVADLWSYLPADEAPTYRPAAA